MNYCPNCGTILKDGEDTCPNCNTKIVIVNEPKKEEVKEVVKKTKQKEKKPPRKKQVTQKRTKYKTQTVTVKEIPLTVKKASKHDSADKDLKEYLMNNREDVDKYYKKDEFVFNISSIIKIIAVILLFILTVYVIFQTAIDNSKKPEVQETKVNNSGVDIFNDWVSSNGAEFIFNKDKTMYWYKSSGDEKNYYFGNFTYRTGNDAISDMGYNEEEFKNLFGSDIRLEDVYSIEIIPTKAIINGKDVTSSTIKANTTWWYILIIKPDGSAMSYNKTLDARYELQIKN